MRETYAKMAVFESCHQGYRGDSRDGRGDIRGAELEMESFLPARPLGCLGSKCDSDVDQSLGNHMGTSLIFPGVTGDKRRSSQGPFRVRWSDNNLMKKHSLAS